MRFKDLSISAKLTLMALTAASVAIFCVVIAFAVQDLRLVNRVKSEQVGAQNSMLATNISALINANQTAKADELLRVSVSEHGIMAAAVISPRGRLLVSVNLAELKVGQSVTSADIASHITRFSREHSPHTFVTPIMLANGEVANLVTIVSFLEIRQRVVFMVGYSMMAMALALLIAFAISWLVQHMVSNPLRSLSELSRRVKNSGDYSLRSALDSHDEIGELAQGFNKMLDQIAQRDLNLERQVQRRTHELEELAEAFRYRALHDTLTGLPNRALLQESFSRAVSHAKRSGKYFALLLLDLDHFKSINDTFGHDVGDELLREVALRIRSAIRGEDRVCRLGGDEFVVLIEDLNSESMAVQIGENLLKDLRNAAVINNEEIPVTVSIGVSIYPLHGTELSVLKHRADFAMYHAKELGRNQLSLFSDELEKVLLHKQLIQADLAKGLLQGELRLYYQPQVNPHKSTLVAVEALLRWNNTRLGVLSPGEFLGYTADIHLLRGIDIFVIKTACEQMVAWLSKYGHGIPVAVNLAAIHFKNSDIVSVIADNLREHRLNPSWLIVELSERLLAEDEDTAYRVARQLRDIGVRIALDNFGIGGSSLHHLRSFPVDIIKMDRSFSRFVHESEREKKLARGIIALAQEYDVLLVAEGVESSMQATTLATLGCEVMQGHWFAEPTETLIFERWLEIFEQHHAA